MSDEYDEQFQEIADIVGDIVVPDETETFYAPEFGGFDSIWNEYVPEGSFGDFHGVEHELRDAFDTGFGAGMADASFEDMMQAREDFLSWLMDEGIDLGDFWEDWREAYGAAE